MLAMALLFMPGVKAWWLWNSNASGTAMTPLHQRPNASVQPSHEWFPGFGSAPIGDPPPVNATGAPVQNWAEGDDQRGHARTQSSIDLHSPNMLPVAADAIIQRNFTDTGQVSGELARLVTPVSAAVLDPR